VFFVELENYSLLHAVRKRGSPPGFLLIFFHANSLATANFNKVSVVIFSFVFRIAPLFAISTFYLIFMLLIMHYIAINHIRHKFVNLYIIVTVKEKVSQFTQLYIRVRYNYIRCTTNNMFARLRMARRHCEEFHVAHSHCSCHSFHRFDGE
jgi:hypothetical protein